MKTDKVLLGNQSKFLQVPASSGHKHSLKEVLRTCLSHTSVAVLGDLCEMSQPKPDHSFCGLRQVERPAKDGDDTLLISDELLRDGHTEPACDVRMVGSGTETQHRCGVLLSLCIRTRHSRLAGAATILCFPSLNFLTET